MCYSSTERTTQLTIKKKYSSLLKWKRWQYAPHGTYSKTWLKSLIRFKRKQNILYRMKLCHDSRKHTWLKADTVGTSHNSYFKVWFHQLMWIIYMHNQNRWIQHCIYKIFLTLVEPELWLPDKLYFSFNPSHNNTLV